MNKQEQATQFAICIYTHDSDLLTPRMVYRVLPDEDAAKSNYIRVIDNEGEDYLYPADYFVLADLPRSVTTRILPVFHTA
ncbi:MAG: hypothetical protein IAF02_23210 [Anaerolineae bacterium]|nr:hypothetical protein [Anaerolineae bacterium]